MRMASQEISLKWNGYQNNIVTNVKELFRDEELADVTLVSEGQSFKAHKVILSANSSLFKNIFQQNPHKDPIIVLHDVNIDSLRSLLTFMYNGEVNVTEEFLPSLLKAADNLRVCGLSTSHDSLEDEKTISSPPPKKRKKWNETPSMTANEQHQQNGYGEPININDIEAQTALVPKTEPIELDYSGGENTIDSDLRMYEGSIPSVNAKNPDENSNNAHDKTVSANNIVSNGDVFTEMSTNKDNTAQNNINSHSDVEKEKEIGTEIEKEIENVLQSGTIVESLSITTENVNMIASEIRFGIEKASMGSCYASPSFPCPFCTRIYNSWGYRRRHVKSRHMTNKLPCKWCFTMHSSQAAWYTHTTKEHGVSHEDARNSLVVMVEAHAVLTLTEPNLPQILCQVKIPNSESMPEKK